MRKKTKLGRLKALEMLRDGRVHGRPLTDKQKRYFGWAASQKQAGGMTPSMSYKIPDVEFYPGIIQDGYQQGGRINVAPAYMTLDEEREFTKWLIHSPEYDHWLSVDKGEDITPAYKYQDMATMMQQIKQGDTKYLDLWKNNELGKYFRTNVPPKVEQSSNPDKITHPYLPYHKYGSKSGKKLQSGGQFLKSLQQNKATTIPIDPQFKRGIRGLAGKGDGNFKDVLKGGVKQWFNYAGNMLTSIPGIVSPGVNPVMGINNSGVGSAMDNPAAGYNSPTLQDLPQQYDLENDYTSVAKYGSYLPKAQDGMNLSAIAGGTGAAGASPIGGITKPLTNIVSSGVGILESNKYNRGESIGAYAGSVGDLALNLVPGVGPLLAQLGIGNMAGRMVGTLFDPEKYKPAHPSTPSGNTAGRWKEYQEGGETKEYMAEIEGGEYVFNPEGINRQSFKMLDNRGLSYQSPVGFVAQGNKHSKDPETSGIKVAEGEGYIASKHLGIDGKKAGVKNPSVADLMVRKGGKALSKGFKRPSDKFGVNRWNPGAVKHHVDMMKEVRDTAEINKLMQKIKSIKNGVGSDYEKKLAISQLLQDFDQNGI